MHFFTSSCWRTVKTCAVAHQSAATDRWESQNQVWQPTCNLPLGFHTMATGDPGAMQSRPAQAVTANSGEQYPHDRFPVLNEPLPATLADSNGNARHRSRILHLVWRKPIWLRLPSFPNLRLKSRPVGFLSSSANRAAHCNHRMALQFAKAFSCTCLPTQTSPHGAYKKTWPRVE